MYYFLLYKVSYVITCALEKEKRKKKKKTKQTQPSKQNKNSSLIADFNLQKEKLALKSFWWAERIRLEVVSHFFLSLGLILLYLVYDALSQIHFSDLHLWLIVSDSGWQKTSFCTSIQIALVLEMSYQGGSCDFWSRVVQSLYISTAERESAGLSFLYFPELWGYGQTIFPLGPQCPHFQMSSSFL